MTVHQFDGYPDNLYFIDSPSDWYSIQRWMKDNEVDYTRWFPKSATEGSLTGIGFLVLKRHYWFKMRWA